MEAEVGTNKMPTANPAKNVPMSRHVENGVLVNDPRPTHVVTASKISLRQGKLRPAAGADHNML